MSNKEKVIVGLEIMPEKMSNNGRKKVKQLRVENANLDQVMSEIENLRAKNRELQDRLAESEGTLNAIRSGEVDAILVSTAKESRYLP